MIRIGKKFLKPHLCPTCGKPVLLVRHPLATSCTKCRYKKQRKKMSHKKQQKKYNTSSYRSLHKKTIAAQPYCALCGRTKDLTCHHAVRVRSGEWRGRHLTVLCDKCHNLWEQKVNKIRALGGSND